MVTCCGLNLLDNEFTHFRNKHNNILSYKALFVALLHLAKQLKVDHLS